MIHTTAEKEITKHNNIISGVLNAKSNRPRCRSGRLSWIYFFASIILLVVAWCWCFSLSVTTKTLLLMMVITHDQSCALSFHTSTGTNLTGPVEVIGAIPCPSQSVCSVWDADSVLQLLHSCGWSRLLSPTSHSPSMQSNISYTPCIWASVAYLPVMKMKNSHVIVLVPCMAWNVLWKILIATLRLWSTVGTRSSRCW